VKVQRPDMIRQVSLDLYLLRRYMRCVELAKHALTVMGVLNQPHPYDVELLDSFAAASYLELECVSLPYVVELCLRCLRRALFCSVVRKTRPCPCLSHQCGA
jgi:hypothetical protein